ncbi:ATP-binding protein [Ideonella azotifigens]|uniref:histidine kinase n=1 Tax=Ideonella azotifigens TaxID=513160 RepID=A0ABN1KMN4_9BURK|nr:ATP-binding protein [Ideonella azotifigens]MCD2343475.1 ATP-binding protein [Ideonella azotifigens]
MNAALPTATLDPPPPDAQPAVHQQVVKIRRDYNLWVASETMEDYALRFTPRAFRKWSEWRVANTAFGAASFLVLEAVGATLLVRYGFANAFWAILATGLVIFLAGLPISVYAARHGVDMDLLTRGAGFGYLGSTLTSLIYASFTFIFFALEAAVMAYALELAFDIPPVWGYLLCALAVIPLVTHGVTIISRLQVWTQPLWLLMLVAPYFYVFRENPGLLKGLVAYAGESGRFPGFSLQAFGAAMTVGVALITQMGEQVDYLRFMPELTPANRKRWWFGVLVGGPGWVLPGVLKMLGGALLAWLAIEHSVPVDRAVDPNQMYLAAYEYVFPHYGLAVAATACFVIVSQLKINVTNAYAGSLAWSNFFSRLTHSHPGRVVWMVFNIGIALMLMELDVFQALGGVLGLFSNIAIAWIMAVVADLVINKPLGLSPPGIEFRRAYLHDVNPVGVGAMGLASLLSVAAHLGAFGAMAQAFSALIALVTALVASPLIAWYTGGRYYLAREPEAPESHTERGDGRGGYARLRAHTCVVCARSYEGEDMARCPAYGGFICSLCCTLDARCGDQCKPQQRAVDRFWQAWRQLLLRVLPQRLAPQVDTGLGQYLLLMGLIVPALGALFGLLYHQELKVLVERGGEVAAQLAPSLQGSFVKAYAALLLVSAVVAWWLVLAHKSRQVAQEETLRQTEALMREIASHQQTDLALQQAKRVADAANQAKTRYITAISHELRTPLNSILGYAQLLEDDDSMPAHRRQAVSVIRRGGDHLLSLIEGTLDVARIEGGKLTLDLKPMRFADCLHELARMFELQAQGKGIRFVFECGDTLPEWVRADERRLRQILINLLGNAVKFTTFGHVTLRVAYAREMARVEIIDSGPGMSEAELARVFEPFVRGSAAGSASVGGTGLGLTISKMLTDLMGGEMTVHSMPGHGSTFRLRLFLPEVRGGQGGQVSAPRAAHIGYEGPRRCILVVDNEEADRQLLADLLQPLGFVIEQAASGEEGLARLATLQPDAIFMDLAMPGIDGWETIRRLRAQALSTAPVAVISANAFDQGLDNIVGLPASDFLVKPVRLADLLDWLGSRLQLRWIDAAPRRAEPVAEPVAEVLPPVEALEALQELVGLGYVRGVTRKLDQIEAEHPAATAFVARLRAMARGFQLDAIQHTLTKALDERRRAG